MPACSSGLAPLIDLHPNETEQETVVPDGVVTKIVQE
jgi:hypothetical protein